MKLFKWTRMFCAVVCLGWSMNVWGQIGLPRPLFIAAGDWAPTEMLQILAQEFTDDTRIPVAVMGIPWPDYFTEIQTIWREKSGRYDMIVGDSQWLGEAVENGHYVDVTDLLTPLASRYTPQSLTYYCEYPRGGGRYFAFPCESDAMGFAYRKDLFENPTEKQAFLNRYGRELTIPKTWTDLRDIAEFFTRPPQYGMGITYSSDYDYITMSFQPILWSFGADWQGVDNRVEGVLNSPPGVKALDFYIELLSYNPPDVLNYSHDQIIEAYKQGGLVMAGLWYAFMPNLNNNSNPYLEQTCYFVLPGEEKHSISLGGQGISISAYSEYQDVAKQFLQWFARDDIQMKWALLGGLSSNQSVLASDEFKQAEPFNTAFLESMPFVKDFYNNPRYAQLLNVTQTYLHQAAKKEIASEEALNRIAQEHEQILAQSSEAGVWDLYE